MNQAYQTCIHACMECAAACDYCASSCLKDGLIFVLVDNRYPVTFALRIAK